MIYLVKGREYIVKDVVKDMCVNKWHVGYIDDTEGHRMEMVCGCYKHMQPCGPYLYAFSHRFAPIHYSDITAELAKQACEERVEVDIKQVERVVNN
jgi:hypothetical protein